jgi:hypothetical protein
LENQSDRPAGKDDAAEKEGQLLVSHSRRLNLIDAHLADGRLVAASRSEKNLRARRETG